MKHLILKTVNSDMTAYGGFVWPESGPVKAPDWNKKPVCGGGLHGALNGEGDGDLFNWSTGAVWIVFEAQEYVDLGGKVKAPSGNVVYCGDRIGACEYLQRHGCNGAIIAGTVTAGSYGTAIAGRYGTAIAGYGGIIVIEYGADRKRTKTGYIGEGGLKPNVAYKLDNNHEFVEA